MKLCIEALSNFWETIKTLGEAAITFFSGLIETIINLAKGLFSSEE